MPEGTHVAATRAMRIAATADLHFGKTSAGTLQPMLSQIATVADALIIAGDLTDYGHPEEARALVKDLTATARIPIVAVLGNHDFESGAEQEIRQILVDAGVQVLDGDSCEVDGIGFAGVKGFAGGFGRGVLGPWGEQVTQMFVHEAGNEKLKLEAGLGRGRAGREGGVVPHAPLEGTGGGGPRG